jgi:hypothetical protein
MSDEGRDMSESSVSNVRTVRWFGDEGAKARQPLVTSLSFLTRVDRQLSEVVQSQHASEGNGRDLRSWLRLQAMESGEIAL